MVKKVSSFYGIPYSLQFNSDIVQTLWQTTQPHLTALQDLSNNLCVPWYITKRRDSYEA